jgi:hypothetical protein
MLEQVGDQAREEANAEAHPQGDAENAGRALVVQGAGEGALPEGPDPEPLEPSHAHPASS